jgi:opacity protein-like surface antigen
MKLMVAGLVGMMAMSSVAFAQPASGESKGFIEGVAQSAFGNVTSQSFGVEGGVAFAPRIEVIAEFGVVRDSSPKSLGVSAQVIASGLADAQGTTVSYSVKQPIGFGQIGIRYTIPHSNKLHPYVEIAGGLAKVKRDVRFTLGGTDVTDSLAKYNTVLGTDLAGSESKLIIGGGGGVVYDITKTVVFDASYRFSRINTDPTGTNVNRVGAGVGIRF